MFLLIIWFPFCWRGRLVVSLFRSSSLLNPDLSFIYFFFKWLLSTYSVSRKLLVAIVNSEKIRKSNFSLASMNENLLPTWSHPSECQNLNSQDLGKLSISFLSSPLLGFPSFNFRFLIRTSLCIFLFPYSLYGRNVAQRAIKKKSLCFLH